MKKNILENKKGNLAKSNKKGIATYKLNAVFQYHFLFLFIGLFFGLKLVFVNPPWQTNDEDRHFYNAFALSEGHISPHVENGKIGWPMPTSLIESVRSFQGFPFSSTNLLSKEKINSLRNQALKARTVSFCDTPSAGILPFPYIPSAIMIKLGGIFKSSPIWLGWWGRIGSLLAYLAIIFIALKNTPHFKPILMVIALSPMALYQGSSVSYDALSFAFLFLLFSLVIKYYYQETPITLKQVILFFLIAFAQKCSKDGYFIAYFTLFAININKFESKKVYFLAGLLLLVASFLPSYLWNSYIGSLQLPGGKFQVDFAFDSTLNIKYHLNDPINTIFVLIQNTFNQGKTWIGSSIGRFGYSYTLFPDWIIILQLSVYSFVVFFEKPRKLLSLKFRAVLLVFALLNVIALIAVGLIIISPVGANYIFGMQGRYFTPLLPFLFLGVFYLPFFADREKLLKWIVPIYCIVILFYTADFLDSKFFAI